MKSDFDPFAPSRPRRKRRYRLTPAGRAAKLEAIQRTRPWKKSTGPRTPMGKLRSSRNHMVHGCYCRILADELAEFRAYLRSLKPKLPKGEPPMMPDNPGY